MINLIPSYCYMGMQVRKFITIMCKFITITWGRRVTSDMTQVHGHVAPSWHPQAQLPQLQFPQPRMDVS